MLKLADPRSRFTDRTALAVCVVATLLAVWLHIVYLTHAGALWRDEAGGVQLSSQPGLGVTCRPAREWFPVFFFALVRGWSALGLGASDFSLRILGFLVGLGLLGAIWLNARLMEVRWPLISLALLAANLTVVRWGDSLRAYGCGTIFILLTLGLIWRLVSSPGIASFVLAAFAATLSVQTLYPNAFLVSAACIAGSVVCIRRRAWKTLLLVLGVGILPALSLLPYVPQIIVSRDCMALHRMGFTPDFLWASLSLALGSGQDWPLWAWFGLLPVVLAMAWETVLGAPRNNAAAVGQASLPDTQHAIRNTRSMLRVPCCVSRENLGLTDDLPLFGLCALVSGVALFVAFLLISGLPAQPWYFLPPMVFTAAALDATLAGMLRRLGIWPPACAAIIVLAMFPTTLKLAEFRQTNIDLIAAELQRRAKPGDLIVVSPAYCGITFARYYKGPVAWTTLPPMDDHSCHRSDLLKQNLCSKALLQGVLDQAAHTLESGYTLWMVGALSPPSPGETTPPDLPQEPAPGQPFGYTEGIICGYVWDRQMAHFLDTRPQTLEVIQLGAATPVIPEENLPFMRVNGWRSTAAAVP
jgi:hypothetical protein